MLAFTIVDRLVPAWHERAECRHHDPALWHPHAGEHGIARQAIAICRTCPVRRECLDAAIAEREQWAVRGGRMFGPAIARKGDDDAA